MTERAPSVAAIVLNYNGRELTLQALASLARLTYPALQIYVVDNGSTDGSFDAVAAAFPAVRQIRTERNLGPAGGNNLGIRAALAEGFDYILILNNDIEVAPDFLGELVAAAERDPTIGCVGPKAYYHSDPGRIWSAGGTLRFGEAVTRERGQGELDRGQFDRDQEVEYVNGCAMLVRREAYLAAGLEDPMFHLCFEDADFCLRLRRRGFRCFYAHRARLWHMVGRTTGGYVPGKTFHSARSTAIFVRRHAGPWGWARALSMIALAVPAAFVRELVRGNPRAVAAKVRGYREGFRVALAPLPVWAREEPRD